jgi:hypothetical protein
MTDINMNTGKYEAIKDSHGEPFADVIKDLVENNQAANQVNGRHRRGDHIKTAATVITAVLALFTIIGVFTMLGGWKRDMEITQTGFGKHCVDNEGENEKVWTRLEEDRDDRQAMKDNMRDQKYTIKRIESKQDNVLLEQKEMGKDMKKILDRLPNN